MATRTAAHKQLNGFLEAREQFQDCGAHAGVRRTYVLTTETDAKGRAEGDCRAPRGLADRALVFPIWSAVNRDHDRSDHGHQNPQQLSVSASVHKGAHLPVSMP
jgi:hypothetical protein